MKRKCVVVSVAIGIALGGGAGRASASCTDYPFEAQVADAVVIFVGTVDRSEALEVSQRGIITRYHFGEIRYIKGAGPNKDLTLAQEGGRIGNEEQIVTPGVSFAVGRRYVVFAHKDPFGNFTAQLCGSSPFGIWADSAGLTPVVHQGVNGGPLLAVQRRHVLFLRDHAWANDYPPIGNYPRVLSASEGVQVLPEERGRPPRRSLVEAIQSGDSTYEATIRDWRLTDAERRRYLDRVQWIALWPHQDLRTRVTERAFVDWLKDICADLGASADSTQLR